MATSTPRRPTDVLLHDAKKPLTPAAGPYGHPFHPILVTLPIGAWISALVFDIATRVDSNGSPALVDGAYWLIGIGILGALVAAVFGLMDLFSIPRGTRALATGLLHLGLNLLVVGLFIVNFFWRAGDYDELSKVKAGQLVLSAIGVGILAVSGWLGGKLAYHYGVRVADEQTQADGYRQA